MLAPWRYELHVLLGGFISITLLGLLSGYLCLLLLLASLAYCGWHLYHLYRLGRWFTHRKRHKIPLPEAPGIWGEIFYHFHRLQRLNRKHKRKLSALLERFKRSTAAMPDAAVVLGPYYQIEWFNHSAQQLLGLQPQDKGQPIRNLIRYPAFGQYLMQAEEQEYADFVSPMNPELMLRVNVVPYTGQRSLLLARDITNFHRLEQIRRDFVANLSHELNTPLTVIGGFVEIMSDAGDSCDAQCQRSLDLIGQQVTRMRSIIDDMLLLSRLESAPVTDEGELIKVSQILSSIYEEAQVLSGEGNHQITLAVDEQLMLIGRSEELRSAFSNLVSNAIRYTPDGGNIHLRGYQDEHNVYVEVHDTGEGIAPEHIPHLTRRFYRVDTGRSRSQGGTGLGLAIVKYVLLRHKGELNIKSVVGEGSIFRCVLPLPDDLSLVDD